MDLFDFLPIGVPGPPEGRTTEESVSSAVAMAIFPLLDVVVVLATGLYENLTATFVLLPLAFALATVLLCRGLGVGGGWTAVSTLGCVLACAFAGGIALLVGIFASLFTAF
jgi:hypothetical protein